MLCVSDVNRWTFSTSGKADVQQPQRVANVTVVAARWPCGVGREAVRRVIVRDDDRTAVGIIAADVAPIERGADKDNRETRG